MTASRMLPKAARLCAVIWKCIGYLPKQIVVRSRKNGCIPIVIILRGLAVLMLCAKFAVFCVKFARPASWFPFLAGRIDW